MPPRPAEPQPATHTAIPNDTWERLCLFLEVQPWKNVDSLIGELRAVAVGVVVK